MILFNTGITGQLLHIIYRALNEQNTIKQRLRFITKNMIQHKKVKRNAELFSSIYWLLEIYFLVIK